MYSKLASLKKEEEEKKVEEEMIREICTKINRKI
jgi:hypothetical protein